MPLLGNLLVALVTGLAGFLGQFLARKVAVIAAGVGALGVITIALLAVFNNVVAPLAQQAFSTEYGQFLGLCFPPVAGNCMAAMGTVWAACTLYGWQAKALSIAVQA
jgi:hypothetical protein